MRSLCWLTTGACATATWFDREESPFRRAPPEACRSASAGSPLYLRPLPVLSGRNLRASCPRRRAPTPDPEKHRPFPVPRRSFPVDPGTLQTWASSKLLEPIVVQILWIARENSEQKPAITCRHITARPTAVGAKDSSPARSRSGVFGSNGKSHESLQGRHSSHAPTSALVFPWASVVVCERMA